MKVAVVNDSGLRVNGRKARKVAELFLRKAARLGKCQWGDISLVLSNDSGIHSINRTFLKHDYPTDVISFSYRAVPGEQDAIAGEIVVNVEMAIFRGRQFMGMERELALYIAHGCDHLTGADDATPLQRRRMRARELRWVKVADDMDLLRNLVTS